MTQHNDKIVIIAPTYDTGELLFLEKVCTLSGQVLQTWQMTPGSRKEVQCSEGIEWRQRWELPTANLSFGRMLDRAQGCGEFFIGDHMEQNKGLVFWGYHPAAKIETLVYYYSHGGLGPVITTEFAWPARWHVATPDEVQGRTANKAIPDEWLTERFRTYQQQLLNTFNTFD